MSKMTVTADAKPMLNAYPDSVGGTLSDITGFLQKPELKDVFSSFYILPSVFNTDLDRGFSVIDYTLNEELADKKDLEALEELGINLKLDFILNHASVLSRQFQDILKNGDDSKYRDFFIDWNKFWEGKGTMTEEGYIQPDQELIEHMFFRKPGLPILMVRFPDGKNVPYWNTFYQEIKYPVLDAQDIMQVAKVQYYKADLIAKKVNEEIAAGKKPSELSIDTFCKDSVVEFLESKRKYLGQMDLNIKSPLVWEFYDETLKTLAAYGAKIVRLDAFAYAPKEPGEKNFLNEPGTWEVLEKVRKLADKYNLTLLPEIHASYGEKNYEQIAKHDLRFLPSGNDHRCTGKRQRFHSGKMGKRTDGKRNPCSQHVGLSRWNPASGSEGADPGRKNPADHRHCCCKRRICERSSWSEKCILSGKCNLLQCTGRR